MTLPDNGYLYQPPDSPEDDEPETCTYCGYSVCRCDDEHDAEYR